MAKSHKAPAKPSRQYIIDRAWLIAFRDCGWFGKRAIAAADKAISHLQ